MTEPIKINPTIHTRRLHIVRTAKNIHFFPIVTFGKDSAYSLFEIHGTECRVLDSADSLFGCECAYEQNTKTQYRTCRRETLDNPNLDIAKWTEWMNTHKDIEGEMRTMYAVMGSQITNRQITASMDMPSTNVVFFRFLYETDRKTGKAFYDKKHLLALWTSDSNGFIARIPYGGTFNFNHDLEHWSEPEPNVLPKRPVIYKICNDAASFENAKSTLFHTIAVDLVSSGNFEIQGFPPEYDFQKIKLAKVIEGIMRSQSFYETMVCTDKFHEKFQVGLGYPTLPFRYWRTDNLNGIVGNTMVAFDDDGTAHEVMRDFFEQE